MRSRKRRVSSAVRSGCISDASAFEDRRRSLAFDPARGRRRLAAHLRARRTREPTTMKHLKPKEASDFLHQNPQAVFVDCRSEMEYLFVGHPSGAHHVAWNDGPDWDINPHFVGQVKKVASMNRPVVLICRSGQRSIAAGIELEKAGFSDVYNVLEGFEGPLDDSHHRGSGRRLAQGRPALGADVTQERRRRGGRPLR